MLVENVVRMRTLLGQDKEEELCGGDLESIEKIARHINKIRRTVNEMVDARKAANAIPTEREKAIAYHDTVIPAMETIRYHIDKLELLVDNEMWPLPKYRELLFIR